MAEVLRIGLSRPLRGLIALALVSLAATLVLRGLWGGPWLMEIKALGRIEAGNALGLFTLALIVGPVLMGIFDRTIGHRRELLAATHSLVALLLVLMAAGAPHYPLSELFGVTALPPLFDGVLLVLIGLAISAQPLLFGMAQQLAGAQNAGKALSAINLAFFLGTALMQSATGVVATIFGLPAVLLFMAATLIVGTIVFLMYTYDEVECCMYPDPNSSSQKMYDRALASLPGGNTRTTVFMKPYPIYAARGEGCRVWDLDGNVYIDCINNFTSQIHGHAHPALIRRRPRNSRWDRRSACRPPPRSILLNCWSRACPRSNRCGLPIPAPRP